MAPSPKVSLNHYLNDLDTYQRKKKNRDPTNRVNIPYYRKVAKLNNHSSLDNANQISIASQLVLVERNRLAERRINQVSHNNSEYPHLEVSSLERDQKSSEAQQTSMTKKLKQNPSVILMP